MKQKQAIAFLLSIAMTTSTVIPVFANDISGHWAEQTISKWQANGKISGYTDGSFRPDRIITRAEFLRLLNNTIQTSSTAHTDITFSDVSKNDWFYADVTQATDQKITTGFSDGTFRPNEPITRAEASMMICIAKQLEQNETPANVFTDNIPAWAKGAIGAVVYAGYLSGYQDGTFAANKGMTRAEAVSALERITTAEEHTQQSESKQQTEEESQQKETTQQNETEQQNETKQQNETEQQGNMVWKNGGSGGGSSKKSDSTTESSQESNIITKDISIYSQKDADKLQKKTVLGKTTIYLDNEITLQDIEFQGDVNVIIMETAGAYMTENTVVPLSYKPLKKHKKINMKGTNAIKVDMNKPNATIEFNLDKSNIEKVTISGNKTKITVDNIESIQDKVTSMLQINAESNKVIVTTKDIKADELNISIPNPSGGIVIDGTIEIENSNIDNINTNIPEANTTIKTTDSQIGNVIMNGENGELDVQLEDRSHIEVLQPQSGNHCTVNLQTNTSITNIITGVDMTISGNGMIQSIEKTDDSVDINILNGVIVENKPDSNKPSKPTSPSQPDNPNTSTSPEITAVALTGLQNLTLQTAPSATVTTSDTGYSIGTVTWKKDNAEVDWTTAQAGNYTASVILTADSEHTFTPTSVTLDGTALTSGEYTCAEDGSTLTITKEVHIAENSPVTLTIPEKSVVAEVGESGTSITVKANVSNAVAGSKVRFAITPNAEINVGYITFSNGTVESTDNGGDIATRVDITNNSAEANLTIKYALKANFTINVQYVDEKGNISDTAETIDVTVKNNPIDYIMINSVSVATPVVGKPIEALATSCVDPVANKGYAVTKVEWGTWDNSSTFNALDLSNSPKFETGKTYAIKATLKADSGMSFAGSMAPTPVGGNGSSNVVGGVTKNGNNVEIIFKVGELS